MCVNGVGIHGIRAPSAHPSYAQDAIAHIGTGPRYERFDEGIFMNENTIPENETEEDVWMPSQNSIEIAWGDVHIVVSGDQTLDDIEDRLFKVLGRLKATLNGDKHHDTSVG